MYTRKKAEGKVKNISKIRIFKQQLIRQKKRKQQRAEEKTERVLNCSAHGKLQKDISSRERKAYFQRKVAILEKMVNFAKKKTEKLRKRYQRSIRKKQKNPTPETIAKDTWRQGKTAVIKRLMFCKAFVLQLTKRKATLRTEKNKSFIFTNAFEKGFEKKRL